MITKQKGTDDIFGLRAKKWKYICNVVDEVCSLYNYNYIQTPVFEASELFHRGIGESTDIVTKETYDFVDRGNRSITLRPEGTAGVVRSYIENKMYGDAIQPIKLYYNETMYRYERPQAGRNREFTQFGFECLGSDDALTDAEVIAMSVQIFKSLGLENIKVNLNSLGDNESRNNYREALIKYFQPKINELCEDCQNRLKKNPLRILDCKFDEENEIIINAPKTIDYLNESSKIRFEELKKHLDIMEIEYEVNPKIVRGLDYYNHTVFEITEESSSFGSQNVIGGGGRYNSLVSMLGGPETSAVGFASGLDRLLLALEEEDVAFPLDLTNDCYVLYINKEEKNTALDIINELRLNNIKCEMDLMGRSLKSQFNTADKLNSKFLIILNSDETKEDKIKIKDNLTKEEIYVKRNDIIDYINSNL